MELSKFVDLIKRGFDIDFNIGEVFYSVSSEDPDNSTVVYLGNEFKQGLEFQNIDALLDYNIDGKPLKDTIIELPDEEFFY